MKSMIKLSKLKLNPSNPRLIKDDKFFKLVKSLEEFPEMLSKRPIVCVTDTDGKIYPLGGNMRLKALQHLKYDEIPKEWVCMADEWTEEKRKEFLIKDNVGFGEWDWDILANEWDADKLNDWGLDVPISFDESKPTTDLSESIIPKFRIEIVLNDEKTQELLYNELIERNYECRLLTL